MSSDVVRILAGATTRLGGLRRVALIAPTDDARALFPGATVIRSRDWDLAERRPDLRFDLIVGPPVYPRASLSPASLGNLLASCRVLLLADGISSARSTELVGAQRGAAELGGARGAASELDVGALGDRLLFHRAAQAASGQPANARGMVALIKGALSYPLIRIDDYPSGIRPILPDMRPLDAILGQFEMLGIAYHLGIVPGILNDDMLDTLRNLKWMIPAQHGFDHCYPRYSAVLTRKRDPYNARGTVGGFNEFAWQGVGTIERKLRAGQALLEQELGLAVDAYIPPCNRCNRATARALQRLGFKLCLSERPVPGGLVPQLRSDFYGRSAEIESEWIPEVIGLHVTWEWDLQRHGDMSALPNLLDRIVAETRAKEAAIDSLARECHRLV